MADKPTSTITKINAITPRQRPTYPIMRRPAKSILPPDVVDGGPPDRPVLVRNSRVRYATGAWNVKSKVTRRLKGNVQGGISKLGPTWQTLEVTIPREVAEIAGWEAGMTVCMEVYVDGRVRLFPAGDTLSREEELV